MLISRISAEKGEKLDMLVEKLVRPYHDAFEPLLLEAMREKLIAEQPLEMIYFMLLHAVTMSVSFRHVLGYFGEPYEDLERLKRDMTQCVLEPSSKSLQVISREGGSCKKDRALQGIRLHAERSFPYPNAGMRVSRKWFASRGGIRLLEKRTGAAREYP